MRIIAGSHRSRTLQAPAGLATRPTSDRLRETLFNVLAPRIGGAAFLDLYAGSGAVGIEALSRGAASVTFVERAPAALSVLRGNLDRLGVPALGALGVPALGALGVPALGALGVPALGALGVPALGALGVTALGAQAGFRIHGRGVAAFLKGQTPGDGTGFDLIFLDPPYDAAKEYAATLGLLGGNSAGLLARGALVIAEHRKKERLEDAYGALGRTRLLVQGDAALSFYGVCNVLGRE